MQEADPSVPSLPSSAESQQGSCKGSRSLDFPAFVEGWAVSAILLDAAGPVCAFSALRTASRCRKSFFAGAHMEGSGEMQEVIVQACLVHCQLLVCSILSTCAARGLCGPLPPARELGADEPSAPSFWAPSRMGNLLAGASISCNAAGSVSGNAFAVPLETESTCLPHFLHFDSMLS